MDRCPDCGAAPGGLHARGCDVERCPACGAQAISCGYCGAEHEPSDRVPWTGEWPGVEECRAFGWYARRVPGVAGWVPCDAGEEGAGEDLNRLDMGEAVWSRAAQRFVRLQ
jgi:hypothetical protein